MLILKFGGTSVGSAKRMREVLQILRRTEGKKLVVLSAMSGTTNALVELNVLIRNNKAERVVSALTKLRQQYLDVVHELFENNDLYLRKSNEVIDHIFSILQNQVLLSQRQDVSKNVLAQGELLSTQLFYLLAQSENISSAYLPALDFMRLNEKSEPFIEKTSSLLKPILNTINDESILQIHPRQYQYLDVQEY